MSLTTIILAAGKSKRMNSLKTKLLFKILGKPIIEHVIDTASSISSKNIICVLNKKDDYGEILENKKIITTYQHKPQGTADAVQIALKAKSKEDKNLVLILCGDVPFISKNTLSTIIKKTKNNDMCLVTANLENPFGYGRIIRLKQKITEIIEEKDANQEIKKINEINTGIICIKEGVLRKYLKSVKNKNKQKEFYLTDLVSLLSTNNHKIVSHKITNILEIMGINTKKDLVTLEKKKMIEKAEALLKKGVLIRDVSRIDIRGTLKAQTDVEIDVNCVFEDNVSLGQNTTVGQNCYLNRCKIGNNVHIKPNTIIFGATIGNGCVVGPYARIRPGTVIKNDVQIGNFVEIKNSTINDGTKINHLSYIGDATLGKNINLGAGTITCNYDGEKKHKTVIESNSFIGSGTRLVAPIKIAKGSYIGAGSTLTKDTIGDGTLTIARARQVTIEKWKKRDKKGKK
tara:strand:+ start:369 stop:1742 length:1374 start_codon:yes stop_codon:yes gene_type:complete